MRKQSLIKFYTFLSVFNPMLAVYISPIPGVDLGTFLILLFMILFFLNNNRIVFRMPRSLVLLLVYTVFTTFIGITGIHYSEPASIFLRLFRYVLVLVVMVGFGFSNYFDEDIFVKYLHRASLIVAGYAMLQAVLYLIIGYTLPGTFGFTKMDYTPDDTLGSVSSVMDFFYRPTSLFYEPSHASYFMCPYLCYLLFINKDIKDKKVRNSAIFLSLGILVTTSGQGLAALVTCWGIWTLKELKHFNLKAIFFLIIAIAIIWANFDIYRIVERVITTDDYSSIDSRRGGYDIIKETPLYKLILGFGYGNYDPTIYYSSFAEIITCTGFIGLFLTLNMYLRVFVKGVEFQKVLVLVSFLLMAGGGIYTASYLCLYLPMLFYHKWGSNSSSHVLTSKQ